MLYLSKDVHIFLSSSVTHTTLSGRGGDLISFFLLQLKQNSIFFKIMCYPSWGISHGQITTHTTVFFFFISGLENLLCQVAVTTRDYVLAPKLLSTLSLLQGFTICISQRPVLAVFFYISPAMGEQQGSLVSWKHSDGSTATRLLPHTWVKCPPACVPH